MGPAGGHQHLCYRLLRQLILLLSLVRFTVDVQHDPSMTLVSAGSSTRCMRPGANDQSICIRVPIVPMDNPFPMQVQIKEGPVAEMGTSVLLEGMTRTSC